jgi:hypothetical protein
VAAVAAPEPVTETRARASEVEADVAAVTTEAEAGWTAVRGMWEGAAEAEAQAETAAGWAPAVVQVGSRRPR